MVYFNQNDRKIIPVIKEVVMARIKINNLPVDQKISHEELQRIRGGAIALFPTVPDSNSQYTVMFNPEEITINKSIEWKDQKEEYSGK